MPTRLYRLYQGLTLIALCLFLVGKVISGKLTWYINLRFLPLTLLGIVLLAIMAQVVFRKPRSTDAHDHDHDHNHAQTPPGNLAILLIPVIIGVLFPARPLDSTAIDSKGVNVSAPLIGENAATRELEVTADQRNILDWIRIFNYEEDLSPYLGQTAKVTGFIYRTDDLPEGQFLVSRFVISCCAADGFAIGIPVQWDGADALEENAWVQVEGPVDVTELDGQKVPLILADTVESIRAPEQPYLFP
jgi:uncharacterized repeat protein (TIGR03943 family)